MTKRLEEALKRLTPEQIEALTRYAERLGAGAESNDTSRYLALDWVGKAADAYPEHGSGVDAAHAALEMMRDSLVRGSSR